LKVFLNNVEVRSFYSPKAFSFHIDIRKVQMKPLLTFASDVRVTALLCFSAAVLLTACGGGMPDAGDGQQTRTAAYSNNSAANQSGTTVAATANAADAATTPAVTDNKSGANTDDLITELYLSLFRRTPDFGGRQFWTQALKDGFSLSEIAAEMRKSPEYIHRQDSPPPPATIYHLYVATYGSDSNSGSATAPFKTITRAASAAKPSTTVHVAPGIYMEKVQTNAKGTPSARIRYVSDTKWGAKIIGSGKEAMWTNNGNYTDIVDFDISGSGRLGILNSASYAVISGNLVHNLEVSGGCNGDGGAGIVNANYSASDNDVIGNVVHDIGVPGSCNGVHGIYHSNLRGRIYNNIVYRSASAGIHLWHAANNVVVANNTAFANGSAKMGGGIVMGAGDSPGGIVLDNTRVVNNVVYDNPNASIQQFCYDGESCIGSNNTIANNLVYGNGRGIALRVGKATGTISADPQFGNYQPSWTGNYYGTGDYRLNSTSLAVDNGTSDHAPLADIDDVARPRGAAADIGAYENY
jgi:hypothetical protein